jgi:hypothetical protein
MYISLRESCMNGFRRWSDLQQQKYTEVPNLGGGSGGVARPVEPHSLGRTTPGRPSSPSAGGKPGSRLGREIAAAAGDD